LVRTERALATLVLLSIGNSMSDGIAALVDIDDARSQRRVDALGVCTRHLLE